MSESARKHREASPDHIRIAVLTISDTRTPETDTGGNTIVDFMQGAGHEVERREIVRDDVPRIKEVLVELLADAGVDAVVTTGGTGISDRDSTYEVASDLIDKKLDGFGEIFRMLSYQDVGAAAMLSRACAGTIRKTAVFALPGSEKAVRLAMEKLIIPELGHVVRELKR